MAAIAAGSIGIYLATAAIDFINYGFFAPPAQSGLALICGATFLADETVPPDNGYPHAFAVATIEPRKRYQEATSWSAKYKIMDEYYCSKTWRIAQPALFDEKEDYRFKRLTCFNRMIIENKRYKQAALAVILHKPLRYLSAIIVKFVGGIGMLPGYDNYYLWESSNYVISQENIVRVSEYIDRYKDMGHNDCDRPDLLLQEMVSYVSDWQDTSLLLKSDPALPLRNLFNLLPGDWVTRLFLFEIPVVIYLLVLRKIFPSKLYARRVLNTLLLLTIPTWGYLMAICLVIIPIWRYMDVTSPFVYLAILVAGWGTLVSLTQRLRRGNARPSSARAGDGSA